ncbi:MAG: ATP-binding protein, partial [Thaumarchaeota archaeon]|nr:ATP-binding protein [Candidatus Calditenuaceae archaeon]
SFSSLLTRERDFEVISRLVERMAETCKHWREARVIAHVVDLDSPEVIAHSRPRHAIAPGTKVYVAPDELLSGLYSGRGRKLIVGTLATRGDVEVGLSVKGLRRHMAIIAQTGAGKSYLAGVMMEELLSQGGTVIVIDPHADYVKLSVPNEGEGWRAELAERVSVYRVRGAPSRHSDVARVQRLEIALRDLGLDKLSYIAGVEEQYVRIRHAIAQAYEELREKGDVKVEGLIRRVEELANEKKKDKEKEPYLRALTYLERLRDLKALGERTVDVEEMLGPKRISVIDLSGLKDREADVLAYFVLSEVFRLKSGTSRDHKYPVFVFVEEAHRFVPHPSAGATFSEEVIKRIAAEGRKFGVFLTLITQRPSKIHPDVLSQCNSQAIMRITNPVDQRAVMEASERLGEELMEDLPGLERGEAIVVGEVVNLPAVIRVRRRRSLEGGADIDVDGLLEEALMEAAREREDRAKREMDWDSRWRGLSGL